MDGLKKRVNDSLRVRLSLWLLMAILSIALTAGAFSFFSALDEAHELQDDVLRQVATLFDQHHLSVTDKSEPDTETDTDAESRVFVQLLTDPAVDHSSSVGNPPLALPKTLKDGMQTVSVSAETYQVLVRTLRTGERLAVAQETAIRDESARNSAFRTLMPFLILIPVLLLVVADLVRKIFKPVADLSSEIDQRGDQELHPIAPEPLPAEIRPFVGAINRLLGRVEQSMEAQRRFVSDAAHELRSPLTAMSLQAERLADSEMSAQASVRLGTLRRGIERGRTLLEQLLALARAQSSAISPNASVSMQRVFRSVLEDLMPLAEAKGIDIGMVTDSDAQVRVNEIDLITLVKNLVDNAIRYTPSEGRVDLSVFSIEGKTLLVVEDNGPGIPEAEWERVFDPFYRVLGNDELGSGLGLSIVHAIANRIGAKVALGFANDKSMRGLKVMVSFTSAKG